MLLNHDDHQALCKFEPSHNCNFFTFLSSSSSQCYLLSRLLSLLSRLLLLSLVPPSVIYCQGFYLWQELFPLQRAIMVPGNRHFFNFNQNATTLTQQCSHVRATHVPRRPSCLITIILNHLGTLPCLSCESVEECADCISGPTQPSFSGIYFART